MKIIMTCFKIAMRVSRNSPGEYSFEANSQPRKIQMSFDLESITLPQRHNSKNKFSHEFV